MKIKHFIFLLFFITLYSCYNVSKPQKPDNLISKDKMVDVLVDIVILSSAKAVNKSKLELKNILPSDLIYKKNNIDSLTFAESNKYYAFDIKTYDAIYLRVRDSLTVLRENYKIISDKEQKEKKKKDSIKYSKIKKGERKVPERN